MAYRYDKGTLKSPRTMPDGRLVVDAKLTRTGVFTYLNPDGSQRREFRPPQEVFNADSLATFPLTSVTNDHPLETVTPENAKAVTVGMVGGNVRRIDDHVGAQLVIFDADAIADIKAGKLELSCGYEAEILDEAGTTDDGEHFDCIQQNIRINHVAIVDVGRAGPEARIRMDASVMLSTPLTQIRTDGNAMDLAEALQRIAALEVDKATQVARADKAEGALAEANSRADVAEADRDTAKEQAEKAEGAHKDANDSLDGRVNALVKLRCDAHSIIPKEKEDDGPSRFDGMSERDIKAMVVKAVKDFDVTKDHSDDYLNARYDSAVEDADKSDGALGELRVATELTRNDAGTSEERADDAAEKRMYESYKWDNIQAAGAKA